MPTYGYVHVYFREGTNHNYFTIIKIILWVDFSLSLHVDEQ
jgi:hypothetical protein